MKEMDQEFRYERPQVYMKENGKITKQMAMADIFGKVLLFIFILYEIRNEIFIINIIKHNIFDQMEIIMKANLKIIKQRVLVYLQKTKKMKNMKDIESMESKMAKVYF